MNESQTCDCSFNQIFLVSFIFLSIGLSISNQRLKQKIFKLVTQLEEQHENLPIANFI